MVISEAGRHDFMETNRTSISIKTFERVEFESRVQNAKMYIFHRREALIYVENRYFCIELI